MNKSIVKGLEKRLGKTRKGWVDALPLVLWAHRTTPSRSNGETPFSLVYGMEALLPAEIQVTTPRVLNTQNHEEDLRLNLDLLEERRDIATIREAAYKRQLKKYYNKRVRPSTFRPEDFVLRLNDLSNVEKKGKLGPNWEGPYIIHEPHGNGSYTLRHLNGDIIPNKWNAVNLKKFYY